MATSSTSSSSYNGPRRWCALPNDFSSVSLSSLEMLDGCIAHPTDIIHHSALSITYRDANRDVIILGVHFICIFLPEACWEYIIRCAR